jgi:hypothetical protein
MWGMSYIPFEEAKVEPPCETLGHFYEDFACIYCPARYCETEKGGHSFESSKGHGFSRRYCHHCSRYVVNISKD